MVTSLEKLEKLMGKGNIGGSRKSSIIRRLLP